MSDETRLVNLTKLSEQAESLREHAAKATAEADEVKQELDRMIFKEEQLRNEAKDLIQKAEKREQVFLALRSLLDDHPEDIDEMFPTLGSVHDAPPEEQEEEVSEEVPEAIWKDASIPMVERVVSVLASSETPMTIPEVLLRLGHHSRPSVAVALHHARRKGFAVKVPGKIITFELSKREKKNRAQRDTETSHR